MTFKTPEQKLADARKLAKLIDELPDDERSLLWDHFIDLDLCRQCGSKGARYCCFDSPRDG